MTEPLSREDLATKYFEQLEFTPYPVQEDALFAWFSSQQGVLVCAPTGTGKTLIAEAALFEAFHTGKTAYYTTPLIALTDQKFQEMQAAAERWGFDKNEVGLVTGNRKVNPQARILVVVAEILLNRLLHHEAFDFSDVSAVVMDEFHNFNDRERGIVWELSLGLLPEHVRTLLLSATVGNAVEFVSWLDHRHNRRLELVQGTERRVPLSFHYIPDMLLNEQVEFMASGEDAIRKTPCLVFCFNRDQCWEVAEQLKGKDLLQPGQKQSLSDRLSTLDLSLGAGPKLKQILQRGVGVHHAGLLPKYRRIVEELFQQKLLSVAVCTETLAAGINLPARSVLLPSILKGPPGKKKIMDPSGAHQIFGRAGRPQYDDQGHVFVLAHEDDVKIARWKEKFDSIPADTKDPGLMKAKKALKKKMPKRRENQQYWNEDQFEKLRDAPPGKLASRGPLPWRLLAHMLEISPDVTLLRELVSKRLLEGVHQEQGQQQLTRMLLTLWRAGYVELEPAPPVGKEEDEQPAEEKAAADPANPFAALKEKLAPEKKSQQQETLAYRPDKAYPQESLGRLSLFRSVNPLYGVFLANQLGIADRAERLQALESVLEMPPSVAFHLRVPPIEELPPGPLATTRLDLQLLKLGLATAEELTGSRPDEEDDRNRPFHEERVFALRLAEKLKLQFDFDFPGVHDVYVKPVWAAGEVLEYGGDFNKFITSRRLQKQEGVIFRHLLRLVLLIDEFWQIVPPDTTVEEWEEDLSDIAGRLTASCRQVDPLSTDTALEEAKSARDSLDAM